MLLLHQLNRIIPVMAGNIGNMDFRLMLNTLKIISNSGEKFYFR